MDTNRWRLDTRTDRGFKVIHSAESLPEPIMAEKTWEFSARGQNKRVLVELLRNAADEIESELS